MTTFATTAAFLPVLIEIQAGLDGDLSLERLAAVARLSPFHFQRLFRARIGETPKQYTLRLRLERAAVELLLHHANVLEIALAAGFSGPDPFTRAFRRHFGVNPSVYRTNGRRSQRQSTSERRASLEVPERTYQLSTTRIVTLAETHLAFLRHLGPYEAVSDKLWAELGAWADRRGIGGDRLWFGIGHDAPGITAPEKLRFDAALRVPGPFEPDDGVAHQVLARGTWAVTTHVGHFSTLPAAYQTIVPRLLGLAGHEFLGLPAVEIYRTTVVDAEYALNHTEIYLPVRKRGG